MKNVRDRIVPATRGARGSGSTVMALALGLIVATPAWSAWTIDPGTDVPVCDTLGNQTQTVAAADGSGGAIVAWIDTRHGAPDVYAQRVTGSGELASGWPDAGLAVCRATGIQTSVHIVSDGQGGAIIAWVDFRAGSADLYAQRVTGAGGVASGWSADGVPVCTATGTQSDPTLVSDGAHGAILAWQDNRSGPTRDIYARRVLQTGVFDPAWPATGRLVCGAPGDQFFPAIAATGGAVIVAWQDSRNTESDVFAQRLTLQGATSWTANGVLISAGTNTQEKPRVADDGAGGAFVCWTDYRDAPHVLIYLQHVVSNGTVAPFWQPDGAAVAKFGGAQSEPAIVPDGSGGCFVSWIDAREGSNDVYLTRLDAFGSSPPGLWQEDGLPVCAAPGAQASPVMATDGMGGVVVAWRDARNDDLYDVFGTRITGGGAIGGDFVPDGAPIGNAKGNQTDLALVGAGGGAAIAAWSDFRNFSHWDTYANRVGPNAVLAVPGPVTPAASLVRVAPNPSRESATLWFTLARAGRVRISIHDAGGRRIRTLVDELAMAGAHEARWDGRDDSGRPAASGIYLARVESGATTATTRFAKLR